MFNELVAARLDVCSLIGNEMVDPTAMWRLHSTVVCVALSWLANLDRKIPLPNTWLASGELSITEKKKKSERAGPPLLSFYPKLRGTEQAMRRRDALYSASTDFRGLAYLRVFAM